MKSSIVKEEVVTLILDENEKEWLKGVMQNPINCNNPCQEEKSDKDMRMLFWSSLGGAVQR